MQLANVLSSAGRIAQTPHEQPGDRGQKFPDSQDSSEWDRVELRGCIAQLLVVIQHKPVRFPDEQSKMLY